MEQETERQDAASTGRKTKWKGPWTRRIGGPVQYVRYTDYNKAGHGDRRIYFAFDLPPGQDRLDPAILAVIDEHKTYEDGYPSGMHKQNSKVWSLPDHEHGRALADRLDMALKELAEKLERPAGHDR